MDIAAWQQLLERLEKLCPCPVVWRVLFPYRVVWINGRAWRLLKQARASAGAGHVFMPA